MTLGKVIGYVERNGGIHHVDCLKYIPLESHSRLCSRCSTFRENVLRGRLARHLQEDSCQSVEANSHTNFRCLTSSEKCERMKNMATVIHTKDQQIARLSGRINKLVANQGIMVDQDTNNDLVSMMKECGEAVQKDNTNPFMKIFWDQQLKAASLGSTRQIRWHPAIIKCDRISYNKASTHTKSNLRFYQKWIAGLIHYHISHCTSFSTGKSGFCSSFLPTLSKPRV